jgi:hypothetical protein
MPKLKVFDWLLFLDRLNTKDIMARKCWQIEGGVNCMLCNSQQLETRDHLFLFVSLQNNVGFILMSSGT